MPRALKVLFWLVGLFVFAGCVAPPTASEAARLNVFMMRWDDVRERRVAPRTAFARNDLPTPIVQNLGWKEQRVNLDVIRQEDGKIIFHTAFPIGRNETRYAYPGTPLAPGSYHLKVTPEHAAPVVQNFSVYGY